jgi:hypothetical protein
VIHHWPLTVGGEPDKNPLHRNLDNVSHPEPAGWITAESRIEWKVVFVMYGTVVF